MKKFVIGAIDTVASLLLILGIIMFFICISEGRDAGRGYYTKDTTAQVFWYIGAAQSFLFILGSFLVYGFSYIVEASCKYLERCEKENNNSDE